MYVFTSVFALQIVREGDLCLYPLFLKAQSVSSPYLSNLCINCDSRCTPMCCTGELGGYVSMLRPKSNKPKILTNASRQLYISCKLLTEGK